MFPSWKSILIVPELSLICHSKHTRSHLSAMQDGSMSWKLPVIREDSEELEKNSSIVYLLAKLIRINLFEALLHISSHLAY